MVSAPTAAASLSGASPKITSDLASDVNRDDFLTLLVAQLQHQDPMNPMENQEFVSELAVFSELEQSTNQTKLLEELVNNQNGNSTTQALSLIGKTASVQTDSVNYAPGDEMEFVFQAPSSGSYPVQVVSESGRVVFADTVTVTSGGQHSYMFDGVDASGATLPPGEYQVQIGGYTAADGSTQALPSFMRGTVEGVNFVDGQPVLMVNGQPTPMSNVFAVFAPNAKDE